MLALIKRVPQFDSLKFWNLNEVQLIVNIQTFVLRLVGDRRRWPIELWIRRVWIPKLSKVGPNGNHVFDGFVFSFGFLQLLCDGVVEKVGNVISMANTSSFSSTSKPPEYIECLGIKIKPIDKGWCAAMSQSGHDSSMDRMPPIFVWKQLFGFVYRCDFLSFLWNYSPRGIYFCFLWMVFGRRSNNFEFYQPFLCIFRFL